MKRRAIISVSDKTGVTGFAKGLVELGFEVVSTGGTARALEDAGIPVTDVSSVTGFPECLDGRVKTLHPNLLAGVLARGTPDHEKTLDELGIDAVELIAVNLYPFVETISKPDVTEEEAIENVDIGGPTMIRAAAKNFDRVTVVTDVADYEPVLEELRSDGSTSIETRRRLMVKVFTMTAAYDAAVAGYLGRSGDGALPDAFVLAGTKVRDLRYGENPHQKAAVYMPPGPASGMLGANQLQGKAISYNNLVDMEAAWGLAREFDQPVAAIIKHTNPCGCAVDADSLDAAYEKALSTDPTSAFGGIVALNREVGDALAERMCEHFFEVIITPKIAESAQEIFAMKKNLRVMEMGDAFFAPLPDTYVKPVSGGLLVQESDPVASEIRDAKVVTRRAPTDDEWAGLEMAWRVTKHVKSNAIVFCRKDRTAAVGAGQMSRVDSAKLAVMKSQEDLTGTMVGSDAFFPFPDGVEEIARAGATAIAQPGGSIRDAKVIEAADKLGLAMVFTGKRHFRHG